MYSVCKKTDMKRNVDSLYFISDNQTVERQFIVLQIVRKGLDLLFLCFLFSKKTFFKSKGLNHAGDTTYKRQV